MQAKQLIKTIDWDGDDVIVLDQRVLPNKEVYLKLSDYTELAEAIKNMTVRGAPLIGVAGAMGVAIGAKNIRAQSFDDYFKKLDAICGKIGSTRPTAVNLFWGIERMKRVALSNREKPLNEINEILKNESVAILNEDLGANHKLGVFGQELIDDGSTVLTHCNAGALATSGYGTALGVIYAAIEAGKRIKVYADETRPRLQGARLTAWELKKLGVDVTLITDNMAATLMRDKKIDACIVGADRIAANGDTANKIGTYSVAINAKYHDIPFYVAAPWSTVDMNTKDGSLIPIEERDANEVKFIGNEKVAPDVKIYNPSFDVTPSGLITAIITERGVAKAPYSESLRKLEHYNLPYANELR